MWSLYESGLFPQSAPWGNCATLQYTSLNPFENQVYFHVLCLVAVTPAGRMSLNPFENQVYFHTPSPISRCLRLTNRLNPFENQVYFH